MGSSHLLFDAFNRFFNRVETVLHAPFVACECFLEVLFDAAAKFETVS